MSRLRKQLIEISKNTKIYEKNYTNLTTKELKMKSINNLETQLYTEIIEETVLEFELTTSRDPSSFLITFTKHLSNLLNLKFIKRGKQTLKDLSIKNVIIIGEVKGRINNIVISTPSLSFFFSIFNMKINRNNLRFGKIDLITHNLKYDSYNKEESIISKEDTAFNMLYNILQRMFPSNNKLNKEGRKKVYKKGIIKTRKIGFLRADKCDFIRFYSFENNEFLSVFDMKLYKCMKGNIEYEGEEIWKSREFINNK